ncbi:hypothetical protein TMEN_6793 [Trichophyton mentagrophytes]|nr:hypothetical protein TMEN_6793 [Trichophyton mentagrophytes]
MPIISQTPNMAPTDEDEAAAECDEPPGCRARVSTVRSHSHEHAPTSSNKSTVSISNSRPKVTKESLLTRALLSSPELSPTDRAASGITWRTVPAFSINPNHSGPSTAELTSDGELTTPPRSTTPSPPPPTQFTRPPWVAAEPPSKPVSPVDEHELKLEANLGRKRCITFACANKIDPVDHTQSDPVAAADPPKRKSTIKFACPARPRDTDVDTKNPTHSAIKPSAGIRGSRSPAPRSLQSRYQARSLEVSQTPGIKPPEPAPATGSLKVTGLGKFELSDATRFQEFGSSLEDEDWLNESSDYKQKMTVDDCMRKENVIRKLGEEVEAEAQEEAEEAENDEEDDDENDEDDDENNDDDEEDEDDDDDDDEEEDEDEDDGNQDLSDDGNETDNEAGFGSSDDEDGESDYAFWTPTTTAATSHSDITIMPPPMKWKESHGSIESLASPGPLDKAPPFEPKRAAAAKEKKSKSTAPSLPDSTDFVCGTLDEDRSIEVAYISRMEERRRQKHIPIPQDIDPSFPTSDIEDEDDEDADDDVSANPTAARKQKTDDDDAVEPPRGRRSSRTTLEKTSKAAAHSPRRLFGHSPRRLRSPPPPGRLRSPPPSRRTSLINPPNLGAGPTAKKIAVALAQRPNRTRTSSLPRTPNPFFARGYSNIYKRTSRSPSPGQKTSTKTKSSPTHTRGPIDIVAGLEKKRQKRKEKFWRQHCRRAAKDQIHSREKMVPGRGAERMKELGIEVAERFRAYGVGVNGGNGPKLVLSI